MDCGELVDDAIEQGRQEGQADILREVAKLSPWGDELDTGECGCDWCDARLEYVGDDIPPHPENGCLYVRALALTRRSGRAE